jgi:hypothetical protein
MIQETTPVVIKNIKTNMVIPEGNSSALITGISTFFRDILISLSIVNNTAGPIRNT